MKSNKELFQKIKECEEYIMNSDYFLCRILFNINNNIINIQIVISLLIHIANKLKYILIIFISINMIL